MTYVFAQLRSFAHKHDTLPAFHAAYLVLAFLAAAMFNLGVFGLLILMHMTLDYVKYREVHKLGLKETWLGMVHESLMDVALFSVGLVFSVYFHHSVGVANISGLLRAELTIVRMLGTLIPKFVMLESFLKIVAHLHHYMEHLHPGLRSEWSRTDRYMMLTIAVCFILLFSAGEIMNVDGAVIRMIVLWELVPWNI